MPKPLKPDLKRQALRAHGALHPRPHQVTDEMFSDNEFFDPDDLVQVKYEMLRRVRVDGQPISQAAANSGLSRPTFYKAHAVFEAEGMAGLVPSKPGPHGPYKLTDEVMVFIEQARAQQPPQNAVQLSQLLAKQMDVEVHPRSIERALARREKKQR